MKKGILLYFFLLLVSRLCAFSIISSKIPNHIQLPTGELHCIFQDSEGYMWYGTEGGGLCRDDGYLVQTFRSDFNTPGLLESNSVICIAEDHEGKIWFGTNRGAYILDKKDYQIRPFNDEEIKKGWAIKTINTTSDGSIWISAGQQLFRFNASGQRTGHYSISWNNEFKDVYTLYESPTGEIWMIQWRGGLARYDAGSDQFIPHYWPYSEFPTCIVKDKDTPYYWIGTWGRGVVRLDPRESDPDKMFVEQPESNVMSQVNKRRVYHILQDKVKGLLWITTNDNLYNYELTAEGMLQATIPGGYLPEGRNILSNLVSDWSGNLWVTGYYPHSYVISFPPNDIINYPLESYRERHGISAAPMQLYQDGDHYWIRQRRSTLYTYNLRDEKVMMAGSDMSLSFFFEKAAGSEGFFIVNNDSVVLLLRQGENELIRTEVCRVPAKRGERIRALHDDKHGNLWISTSTSLFRYGLKQGKLTKVYDNIGFINRIASLDNGDIYLATETDGLWKIEDGHRTYKYDTEENYRTITTTPDQKIWIGTEQGNVYCYNPEDNSFLAKTEDCGLTGNIINDMQSDIHGNVWILTDQTIVIYHPEKQVSDLIHCSDPSIGLDNFLSLHRGENGEMHIGGRGGIVVFPDFNPVENRSVVPTIRLTSVKVNDRLLSPGRNGKKIVLNPKERNIELFFSTFDPLHANKIRFAFRNKQHSDYWNHLPVGQNRIFLTELTKGNYEIEVRATDENGLWSDDTITVQVHRLPAWYETWWAFTLYLVILLGLATVVIHKYIEYQRKKQRLQLEEEISKIKYRFFTNISHELRTPLTLIITPLESIIRKATENPLREQLESIYKNAQNLLALVNQLLDFRKIEMGGEQLSLTREEINLFLSSIYENFRLAAVEKNKQLIYHSEISSLYIAFDGNKLRKMVNNLLSNALKFTQEGDRISLTLTESIIEGRNYVVISVKDNGQGIPARELPRIFERFHQVQKTEGESQGSGIGLHLVKEYAALHQGDVTVESELGKGSVFSIYIPTDLSVMETARVSESVREEEVRKETGGQSDTGGKKILIVEDNTEFRNYLTSELRQYYTVFEASDGLEGEKEAMEKEPDIILTDLMMPGIDGIELCRRVKNNITISHIPVILLTANTNIENEKRGYKEGADAFIFKPFHWEILLSRIENLMEQKAERHKEFEQELEVKPDQITISPLDELLIRKALEMVEKNLSNAEYSIEDLSSDMCMSRANLYRKINSITGLSPTDFVKNIRLKKAAELLKEGQFAVVEIADKVGFNTPSYFTKSFKKMFGVLPTQYK